MLMSLVFYENPSSDESIDYHSGVYLLEHVKLLDCLSDLHKPLINWISSGSSPATSSGPVDNCFICINVHGFPICVLAFVRREKHLKLNTSFCRSYGGSETSSNSI